MGRAGLRRSFASPRRRRDRDAGTPCSCSLFTLRITPSSGISSRAIPPQMPVMVPLVLQDLARHSPLDPPVTAEVLAFVITYTVGLGGH